MLEYVEVVAKLGAIIIATGTVIAALIGAFSYARFFRRSAQTLLFMRYTERFEKIMDSFPEEAVRFRFNLGALPERSAALSLAVLKYFNLCSEEWDLYKKGYIEPKVWAIWEGEMRRMLQSPLFVREWQALQREFEAYPEFQLYIKAMQAGCEQPAASSPSLVPAPNGSVTSSVPACTSGPSD
jgi:hypothetical protein